MMYRRRRVKNRSQSISKKAVRLEWDPRLFHRNRAVRECLVVSQRMALKIYIEKKKTEKKEKKWDEGKRYDFYSMIENYKGIRDTDRQTDVGCTEEDSINVPKGQETGIRFFLFFFFTPLNGSPPIAAPRVKGSKHEVCCENIIFLNLNTFPSHR